MAPDTTESRPGDPQAGRAAARPGAAGAGAPRIGVHGEDPLEPERRCHVCGAKLTVQILPHGSESHCTPCERRARAAGNDG